jgi:hypothetical protein
MRGTPGVAGQNGTSTIGNPGDSATPGEFNSIVINPTATYPVTVPSGGFITIKWYAQ